MKWRACRNLEVKLGWHTPLLISMKRHPSNGGHPLTDEETDACIYTLEQLRRGRLDGLYTHPAPIEPPASDGE